MYSLLSFIEKNEDKHFYRTTFTENEAPVNNSHGLTKLSFDVECAWSAENCLVNPDADAEDCISLEELCKQLKVQRLSARFEEHGLMFGETLYYDKEDGLSYDSFELETEADIDFDDDEEYIDDEEPDNQEEKMEPKVTFNQLFGIPESAGETK